MCSIHAGLVEKALRFAVIDQIACAACEDAGTAIQKSETMTMPVSGTTAERRRLHSDTKATQHQKHIETIRWSDTCKRRKKLVPQERRLEA